MMRKNTGPQNPILMIKAPIIRAVIECWGTWIYGSEVPDLAGRNAKP